MESHALDHYGGPYGRDLQAVTSAAKYIATDDTVGHTFWLLAAVMFASSVFFFVQIYLVPRQWANAMLSSGIVTGVAWQHYLYMRELWAENQAAPTLFRYMDWLVTVPLQVIQFYLILVAATPPDKGPINPQIFVRLLVASLLMLVFGYMGETGTMERWVAFPGGMVAWIYIVYEIYFGEASRKSNALSIEDAKAFLDKLKHGTDSEEGDGALKDVKRLAAATSGSASATKALQQGTFQKPAAQLAFEYLRAIFLLGWALYPTGYVVGGLYEGQASEDTLNAIYNIADLVNKVAFGLAIYSAANSTAEFEKFDQFDYGYGSRWSPARGDKAPIAAFNLNQAKGAPQMGMGMMGPMGFGMMGGMQQRQGMMPGQMGMPVAQAGPMGMPLGMSSMATPRGLQPPPSLGASQDLTKSAEKKEKEERAKSNERKESDKKDEPFWNNLVSQLAQSMNNGNGDANGMNPLNMSMQQSPRGRSMSPNGGRGMVDSVTGMPIIPGMPNSMDGMNPSMGMPNMMDPNNPMGNGMNPNMNMGMGMSGPNMGGMNPPNMYGDNEDQFGMMPNSLNNGGPRDFDAMSQVTQNGVSPRRGSMGPDRRGSMKSGMNYAASGNYGNGPKDDNKVEIVLSQGNKGQAGGRGGNNNGAPQTITISR